MTVLLDYGRGTVSVSWKSCAHTCQRRSLVIVRSYKNGTPGRLVKRSLHPEHFDLHKLKGTPILPSRPQHDIDKLRKTDKHTLKLPQRISKVHDEPELPSDATVKSKRRSDTATPNDCSQESSKPNKIKRAKHLKKGANGPNTVNEWKAKRDELILSMDDTLMDEETYADLADELMLEENCRPQVSLLSALGLTKDELCKILGSRVQMLKYWVPTLRRKLEFLRDDLGLSASEVRKLLVKFPRILEYKTEKTIRAHLNFFTKHGVAQQDLSKVMLRAPMLLEMSIASTLTPRIQFLVEVAKVPHTSIGKLITRHPQVLTCTVEGMQLRVTFLQNVGLDLQGVGKVVLAHPQVLHYSVSRMEERVRYLLHIGMTKDQLAPVIQRLPQLLSLDIRKNLVPKFDYLVTELGGDVQTLATYPGYLSLSLSNRIIPRHRFLKSLRADPLRPFPMNYLKCNDERFAQDVAGSSLQRFEAFRMQMSSGGLVKPR